MSEGGRFPPPLFTVETIELSDYTWQEIPVDTPVTPGMRVLLAFNQRGFGSRLDSAAEAEDHFYKAELRAFNGDILSKVIGVKVSTASKLYDYLLLVEVGGSGYRPGSPVLSSTVWKWAQRIAEAWSHLAWVGYVRLVGVYYPPEGGNTIPEPPVPHTSIWDALKWGGVGLAALALAWALSALVKRR